MNILIIEDDEFKRRQLLTFFSEEYPLNDVKLAGSYTSGVRAVRTIQPDVVVLDMSLPNYDGDFSSTDGGKFRSYGGRDILHQIVRRNIPSKVIVVTAYDTFSSDTNATTLATLSDELRVNFPQNFLDIIFYSASNDEWKLDLRRWMGSVL